MCDNRRSVLPLAQVRAAVEEFCRTGTGDRPECIRWVRGEINGERWAAGGDE
ncbi:Imm1 family immunity protein [Micromonospora sp. NPDC005367]|uniref:Imm1 family immunity protein n=1 Tax=Micromonospora sp. NPDC005367 TaxID=3155590 RepID=UPI0033A2A6BA